MSRRPVLAVVGDGSSLYAIQVVWRAAHSGCGVLFLVLANGRYVIMDRLAEQHGSGKAPWPAFEEVSVSQLAPGCGCPAQRADTHPGLLDALDELVPSLVGRTSPLLLEVAVEPDPTFEP